MLDNARSALFYSKMMMPWFLLMDTDAFHQLTITDGHCSTLCFIGYIKMGVSCYTRFVRKHNNKICINHGGNFHSIIYVKVPFGWSWIILEMSTVFPQTIPFNKSINGILMYIFPIAPNTFWDCIGSCFLGSFKHLLKGYLEH